MANKSFKPSRIDRCRPLKSRTLKKLDPEDRPGNKPKLARRPLNQRVKYLPSELED